MSKTLFFGGLVLLSGLVAADPQLNGAGNFVHSPANTENDDDELIFVNARLSLYPDSNGLLQGYFDGVKKVACATAPVDPGQTLIIGDADMPDQPCVMVRPNGQVYHSWAWKSVVKSTLLPGEVCELRGVLRCTNGHAE